ncbi:MAG TPA: putative O-glycosylation ligase, exosortase A system-associated [Stellaceae bacterium]
MRGYALALVFFGLLPFIFIKGPFFGILMWFWVSLMSPHRLVWGGPFADPPYALIVAVATLLAWLLSNDEPKAPPWNKTTLLLLLMMLWISVTSLLGTGPPAQIYDKWQLTEKMLLMTIVAFMLTTTRARLDQLIVVCVLSVAFFGFKGGIFTLLHGGVYRVYGPEGTMIGDNNDLGVALTMMLPLLFYLRERYPHPALKWPMMGFIGLTALGDFFTYSRGALVAVIAMGAVLWFRTRKKITMTIWIALTAAGVWNFAPAEWIDRMATIETYQKDESAESRLYMWQLSWEMARKRPITGAGFHWSFDPRSVNRQLWDSPLPKLDRPRAPHSDWFEMLGDHGFPGLAIYIAIIASAALDASWLVRRSRRQPDLLWANNLGRMLQAALIGYCVGGSFATLATYDGFFAVVIIAAAARRALAAELASRQAGAVNSATSMLAPRPGPLRPQASG